MEISIQAAKNALRKRVKASLAELGDPGKSSASKAAATLLEQQSFYKDADSILFYAPLSGELDIWPLFHDSIRAGKRVFLPRYLQEEKTLKRFGENSTDNNTPLKRGVNETGKTSDPLSIAGADTFHTVGTYVACEVMDPEKELRLGRFGIREPIETCPHVPLNRLDFVLVPGIAFDLHGRRLGRGKGYYDQLLTDVRGKICGVAFDEQIVSEIPVEPHDIPVNCILTPTRWIEL